MVKDRTQHLKMYMRNQDELKESDIITHKVALKNRTIAIIPFLSLRITNKKTLDSMWINLIKV